MKHLLDLITFLNAYLTNLIKEQKKFIYTIISIYIINIGTHQKGTEGDIDKFKVWFTRRKCFLNLITFKLWKLNVCCDLTSQLSRNTKIESTDWKDII